MKRYHVIYVTDTLYADLISEMRAGNGVVIDGVTLKDGGGTFPRSVVWDVSSTNTDQDNVYVTNAAGVDGSDEYGASLGFSRVEGTAAARRAAIVAHQNTTDPDATGLSIFVHPSSTGADDLALIAEFGYVGNSDGVRFPADVVMQALAATTGTFSGIVGITSTTANQLTVAYDGSHYMTVNIVGDGTVTFDMVGGALNAFNFADAVNVAGGLTAQTGLFSGTLTSSVGRIKNTTRATTTYQILVSDDQVFCNTDGSAWTATLPGGIEGQSLRIINTGSSANNLTLAPTGAEHLLGANSNFTLMDGEALEVCYNATDGWY